MPATGEYNDGRYILNCNDHRISPAETVDEIRAQGPEYALQIARNILFSTEGHLEPAAGVAEAALILGIGKSRLIQLKSEDLPAPIAKLKATPVWRTIDIVAFALARNT